MRALITVLVPMLVALPLSAQEGALRVRDTMQSQGRFTVEMKEGSFVARTVEGLGQESQVAEPNLGPGQVGHQTHRTTLNRVRLTMPTIEPNPFVAWRHQVVVGDMAGALRVVRIVMRNQDRRVAACWTLHDAWPSSAEFPPMHAAAGPPAILIVELTYLRMDFHARPCERS